MKIRFLTLIAGLTSVAAIALSSTQAFAGDGHHDRSWRGHGHGHGHWKGHHRNWDHHGWRGGKHHRRQVTIINQFGGYPAPVQYYAPPVNYYTPAVANGQVVRCSRGTDMFGPVVGGAAGGLIGTQIGKGHGRDAAMIGGAILGTIMGGRNFNYNDEYCVSETVSYAPIGTPVAWHNPETNYGYQVTPTRDWRADGRYCREYQTVATVGGRYQETYGTACWQPDGSWEIIN